MAKLRRWPDEECPRGWEHWCPGCEEMHPVAVDAPLGNGAKWAFDGNLEQPTFSPSVMIDSSWQGHRTVCHYFIREGHIEFCPDCTHGMRMMMVPLPDIPEDAA